MLALVLAGCSHAPAREDRFAALDAMLETQARDLMLPGVSAALMERGELVWTGARGWADVDARTPVTPDTPFNIASLTKPMTGVVLMQLVERGRLDLDTPMQLYDPAFTDARITVGHVLSMRKADNRTLVFVRDESGRVTRVDVTWPDDPETYTLPRM